jgi:methylenetetrahydrofolate--tRNA-(uracil-5-)-methyltransferase
MREQRRRLLHEEMRRAGSLIMRAADAHKLPAGSALAVDRHGFSAAVQERCSPIRW